MSLKISASVSSGICLYPLQELEEMKKTEETADIGEITEEETTAVVGETETVGTTGTEDAAVVPEEIITEEYGIDKTKQGSEADTEGHQ